MTPELYKRLWTLVDEAQKRGTDDRQAFLDEKCAAEPALRAEVEKLLAEVEKGTRDFLAKPSPMAVKAQFAVPSQDAAARVSDTRAPTLAEAAAACSGRYELGEEIARGGMGVVYRATDTAFGREVAVKVLQNQFGAASSAARRFDDEARITGQLQHPAIPPVHDLGTLPDGRPFLAMRLVKGRTLDELIANRGPGSMNLVAVFEQVCQAVGYAHAHGVIHRDLKPANVMVGAFGEVQVMDWGLAKLVGPAHGQGELVASGTASAAETEITSERDDCDATRAGSVLGTPAYMPPEQAIGAVDQVDTRSDVFGLGAILCEILTGKPPFLGADSESTRQLAARGKLDDALARLGGSGAEDEFVVLCKRCLSVEKTDRPANAGEVATAVAGLRTASEERTRRAQLDRVRAEAESREQRKRRRVQLALTAAVGVLLGVAWYADRKATQWRTEADRRDQTEQVRLARNAEALAELVSRCEAALREGEADRAAAAMEQVDRRLPDGGGDAVRDRAEACRTELALLRELDALDALRWTPVENAPAVEKVRSTRLPVVLAQYGISPGVISAEEVTRRVSGSPLRERLLTALDLWLAFAPSASVREVLQSADRDQYRDSIRDAFAARDDKRLTKLVGGPEALTQSPRFATVLGQHRAIPVERRRQVLEAALRSRPGDLALLMALGESYKFSRREGAEERLRWFQAAIAAHPRNVAAHINLADALLLKGDLDGSAAACREVTLLDPMFAPGHHNLGVALKAKGDLDGALACYREAARLDPKEPKIFFSLASTLRRKGDLGASILAYNEALRLVLAKGK